MIKLISLIETDEWPLNHQDTKSYKIIKIKPYSLTFRTTRLFLEEKTSYFFEFLASSPD